MESLTKEFKVETVFSSATAEHLDGGADVLRPLGEAVVRGKTAPLHIFTLK